MSEIVADFKGTKFQVTADINIYQALKAIEYFVNSYPEDRISVNVAERLEDAAIIVRERLGQDPTVVLSHNGVCVEYNKFLRSL